MFTVCDFLNDFSELMTRPSIWIGNWIAEEVEKDGLGEGVELGEGGAALGPQRLRPVQYLRNPPLLRQRWQGKLQLLKHFTSDYSLSKALRLRPQKLHSRRKEVIKKSRRNIFQWPNGCDGSTNCTIDGFVDFPGGRTNNAD